MSLIHLMASVAPFSSGGVTANYRTVIKFGDTQQHPVTPTNQATLVRMIDWIIANRDIENIDFVMFPGDIINDGTALPLADPGDLIFGIHPLSHATDEWTFMNTQIDRLEAALIPYVLCRGNHDNIGEAADITAGLDVNGFPFYYSDAHFDALETTFAGQNRFFQHETGSPSGLSHVFRVKIGDNLVRVVAPTYSNQDNSDNEVNWAIARLAESQDIPARVLTHTNVVGSPDVFTDIVEVMATVAPQLFATDDGHNGGAEISVVTRNVGSDPDDEIIDGTTDFSLEPSMAWLVRERFYLDGSGAVAELEADMYNVDTQALRAGATSTIARQSFIITPPSTSIYDLYGTDTKLGNIRGTIPFTVTWPTAPVTNSNVFIVDSSPTGTEISLATALSTTGGGTFFVNAGNYATLALEQNDQHWILADEAVFTGLSTTNVPTRIIVEGGRLHTSGTTFVTADDLLLRNIEMNFSSSGMNFGVSAFGGNPTTRCNRLALVHNTMVGFSACIGTTGGDAVVANAVDFIIAANYLAGGMDPADSGGEYTMRIQGATRVVVVDNRARNGVDGGTSKHTYRSHHGTQDYWARRNMTEYGDGIFYHSVAGPTGPFTEDQMGDHWVYDYECYTTNASQIALRRIDSGEAGFFPGVLTTDGNAAFTDLSIGFAWNQKAGDSIGVETVSAHITPPLLSAWLTADGLQPGADH